MCLLSTKMRCCKYNPAEKKLKECLFRAADWCGFHQSTATGAQKKTSQILPMLSSVTLFCEKLSKLSTSVKFVEKIVKLVKKYWKIVKNCQICPKMSCPNQRLVISSLQYVPKAKGGSVLSCMYYCRLCLGKRKRLFLFNTATGPRGSVKGVWKSIWWWKSESGLTKYENSIWLRV